MAISFTFQIENHFFYKTVFAFIYLFMIPFAIASSVYVKKERKKWETIAMPYAMFCQRKCSRSDLCSVTLIIENRYLAPLKIWAQRATSRYQSARFWHYTACFGTYARKQASKHNEYEKCYSITWLMHAHSRATHRNPYTKSLAAQWYFHLHDIQERCLFDGGRA